MAVDTSYVKQYENTIRHLAQQEYSRLREAVMYEDVKGEEKFLEYLPPSEPTKGATRNGDTVYSNTDYQRRKVITNVWRDAKLIEKFDKRRMLVEPTSPLAKSMAQGFGRAFDKEIIRAFFATAYTGKDGTTSVSFDSNNVVAVDYQFGGGGSATHLTVDKLRRARAILRKNQAINMNEKVYIAVDSDNHDALFEETTVISNDFNDKRVVVDGEITYFMGFHFIHTEFLETDSSGYLQLPVWTESGMALGVAEEMTTKIDEMPNKNYATQVFTESDFGSTRVEESKVVKILSNVT